MDGASASCRLLRVGHESIPVEPQALVVERDRMVGRRLARVLSAAGFSPRVVEAPPPAGAPIEGIALLVADGFDLQAVAPRLIELPSLRAIFFGTAPEVIEQLIPVALRHAGVAAILSRASFADPPREAELLLVARRLARPAALPFGGHLSWGARGFSLRVTDGEGRAAAVARVEALVTRMGAPNRIAELQGELAHELLMNALYDAPTDGAGHPVYAHDRKAEVRLSDGDAATIRCASDGVRVAIEVEDRFGRLTREHLFGSLVRGLQGGAQDRSGGGAGLGLTVVYRNSTALHVEVEPGARTRLTALFELDLNLRDFRRRPRSLAFFMAPTERPAR